MPKIAQTNRNNDLLIASEEGDYDAVKSLLRRRADIEALSVMTPSYWAVYDGETSLMKAARKGHTRVVELLLDKQADITHRDPNRWPVLSSAVAGSHPETVQLLLERKAHPNAVGWDNRTALMLASCHQRPDITKLLVKAKGNVNAQDGSGGTALMDAVNMGTEDSALRELLTTYRADPDLANKKGNTALIHAVKHRRPNAIPVLVEENADVAHVDNRGMTALLWAAVQKDSGISAALLLESLQSQNAVSEAPRRRNREEPAPQVFVKRLRSQQNKE